MSASIPDGITPETSASLPRQAIRSALWTGLSQYWLFGLGLVKTVVLARLVPPEWFGVVAVGRVWVSYLTVLKFDFRTAILAWDETASVLTMQFWLDNLMAVGGLALAGLLYFFAPPFLSPAIWASIFVLLGMTLFEGLTSTPRYLAEKHLRHNVIGRLTIFHSLLGFGVAAFLAWRGFYLPALLLDVMMPVLVTGAGLALVMRWRPRLLWDGRKGRELLSFGFTMWTAGLLGKIIFQFDDWLVGTINKVRPKIWLSSGVLPEAFYSRAYVAGKMPMDVFAGMISLIALPLYARSESEGREMLRRAYRRTTWLLTYMIFFSSAFALIAAEEVVTILLGERWLPTVPLFRLMSLFVILRPLYQNASQMLLAVRREKEMRRTVAVQAIFILVTCPPAVYFWGAAGASVVVSLMSVLGLVAAERYVTRELGERAWPIYVVPALTAVVLLGGLTLANPWLPENIWLSAVVKGVVCALGFGGAALLLERKSALAVYTTLRQTLGNREKI